MVWWILRAVGRYNQASVEEGLGESLSPRGGAVHCSMRSGSCRQWQTADVLRVVGGPAATDTINLVGAINLVGRVARAWVRHHRGTDETTSTLHQASGWQPEKSLEQRIRAYSVKLQCRKRGRGQGGWCCTYRRATDKEATGVASRESGATIRRCRRTSACCWSDVGRSVRHCSTDSTPHPLGSQPRLSLNSIDSIHFIHFCFYFLHFFFHRLSLSLSLSLSFSLFFSSPFVHWRQTPFGGEDVMVLLRKGVLTSGCTHVHTSQFRYSVYLQLYLSIQFSVVFALDRCSWVRWLSGSLLCRDFVEIVTKPVLSFRKGSDDSESLGPGASLAPRTRQRISLGSENDWKFRLRSSQSWKASTLSLGVVVPT